MRILFGNLYVHTFCFLLLSFSILSQCGYAYPNLPFGPPEYRVGDQPSDIEIADLNQDGFPDLAVVNQASQTLSVLLSNGNDDLQTQVSYPMPAHTEGVASGFIDAGGSLDLAVFHRGGVQFMVNDRQGSFIDLEIESFNYPAPEGAIALETINEDLQADLILAAGYLEIHINDSLNPDTVLFRRTALYELLGNPQEILFEDFNGDSIDDVAVCTSRHNVHLAVYIGSDDPLGSFADAVNYDVGARNARGMASGDLNGDGSLDLVISDIGLNVMHVLENDGSGTFIVSGTYALGAQPQSIALGDLNQDGLLDGVAANRGQIGKDRISVLLGHGDGTFADQVQYRAGKEPFDIELADFNQDELLDAVVANYDGQTVSILPGNGDGTLTTEYTIEFMNDVYSVSAIDMNTDGKSEMIVHTLRSLVFESDPHLQFEEVNSFRRSGFPKASVSFFFNPDNYPDLLLARDAGEGQAVIFLGDGTSDFSVENSIGLEGTRGTGTPVDFVLADFDGRNGLDLAGLGPKIFLKRPGLFMPSLVLEHEYEHGGTSGMAGGDFDLDGDIDLAMADNDLGAVLITKNVGSGVFPEAYALSTGNSPQDIAAADMDGDTDIDLVVIDMADETLAVLENIGDASFAKPVYYASGGWPQRIIEADFDMDGNMDFGVSNKQTDNFSIFFGDGTGQLNEVRFGTGIEPEQFVVHDLEGDTDPDILIANYRSVTILENHSAPADLSVELVRGVACRGYIGGTYRFAFLIQNLGPGEALNVKASVITDASRTRVESAEQVMSGTGTITLELGTIAAGRSATVAAIVQPSATGDFSFQAQVSTLTNDPEVLNNIAAEKVQIDPAPSASFDMSIAAVEITQGIQNFANDVPLIQGKETLVRVFVNTTHDIRGVQARITAKDDLGSLQRSPLSPMDPCQEMVASGFDRSNIGDSFNFFLPRNWLHGQYEMTIEVNPAISIPENNLANNRRKVSVEFVDLPPICVKTFGTWTTDAAGHRLEKDSSIKPIIHRRALTQLPTQDVRIFPQDRILKKFGAFGGPVPYQLGFLKKDGALLLHKLWWIDQTSNDPNECDRLGARTHYMAIVHMDSDSDFAGLAPFFDQSWVRVSETETGYNWPWGGVTLAHELGHNYGRPHVRFGGSGPEPLGPYNRNYPYDVREFAPQDPEGYYGTDLFDLSNIRIIAPIGTEATPNLVIGDLMSYANQVWISDYNWRDLMCKLNQRDTNEVFLGDCLSNPFVPKPSAVNAVDINVAMKKLLQTGEALFISGLIGDTTAEFLDAYRLAQEDMITQKAGRLWSQQKSNPFIKEASGFHLELVDRTGTILQSEGFRPFTLFDSSLEERFFGLVLPYDPASATIRVTNVTDGVLFEYPISENAPTVEILRPVAGEIHDATLFVQWTAADMDGEDLSYLVQYSNNMGMTWQAIAFDIASTSLEMEPRFLPGSNGKSLIRIIANDGVNTGSDISGAFSLINRNPVVTIERPDDNAVFEKGQPISLQGSAYDPEAEGFLSGESLRWSLLGESDLGTGEDLYIDQLPQGEYTVQLEAMDSDGYWGMDSITFQIGEPLAANVADLNGDGLVDETDLLELLRQLGTTEANIRSGFRRADLNDDDIVDISDLLSFQREWQPEI